jgi:tetratricopeptide (TPR) repeat protein
MPEKVITAGANEVSAADEQSGAGSRPRRVPLDGLPGYLSAGAEQLLIGVSVYREPADRNAVLFQVGVRDWTAARAPDRQGPAPPYQPPADFAEMLAVCEASGMFIAAGGSAGASAADDGRSVFVEAWLASELHRTLAAEGRGAELKRAHRRAAEYWQWRSAAWPQGRRADMHDLLEARHHLFDAGDSEQANALTDAVCAQLHAWGDLGREAALIQETLDRLPARSAARAGWIHELGKVAEVRGDHAEAERRYQQALDMFAAVGDRAGASRSYHSLGILAQAQGDYARAEHRYRQAADAAGDIGAEAGIETVAAAPAPPSPPPPSPLPPSAGAASPPPADPGAASLGIASLGIGSLGIGSPVPASPWAVSPSTDRRLSAAGSAKRPAMTPVAVPRTAAGAISGPAGTGGSAGSAGSAGSGHRHRTRWAWSWRLPGTAGAGGPAGSAESAGSGHRHRTRWAWSWRLPGLTAATLAAAALSVVQISGAFTQPSGGRSPAIRAGTAAAVRLETATWVKHEVSVSAIVSCDPAMCAALQARGVPAGSLLTLGPAGSADPLGSNVVVATAPVRSELGARLTSVYAPVAVASFGAGGARIEVRVVAPDGSAAYLSALRSDLLARRSAGAQLLLNQQITVTGPARHQLADGLIDSRVLITLAVLARIEPLRIIGFGGCGPGASSEIPMPAVEISESARRKDQKSGQSTGYLTSFVTFLHAQRPPFLAARVRTERLGSGQPALRIDFAYPSPLGLLATGTIALPITNHK